MKRNILLLCCIITVFSACGQEPLPMEEMDPTGQPTIRPTTLPPAGYEYNEYGYLITSQQGYWRKRGSNYARSYYDNEKYGMKASDGTILISAQYDYIHFAYSGFMIAVKEGKYGVVNEANDIVVPFNYTFLELLYVNHSSQIPTGVPLSDLRLLAKVEQQTGIINGLGEIISPFREARHTETQYFYDATRNDRGIITTTPDNYQEVLDGTALIYRFDGAGVVNIKGDTLLPFIYDDIKTLYGSTNPVWVQVEQEGKWGLYDLRGEWELPIQYQSEFGLLHRLTESGQPFFPTLFITSMAVDTTAYDQVISKAGLIDSTGKEVLPFAYDGFGTSFEWEGKRHFFAKQNDKWGLVNSDQEVVIPFEHGPILRKYELDGELYFSLKDPTDTYYGLLSMENELAVPFRYKWLDEGNGQLLEFMDEAGASGLLNAKGEEVLKGDYSGFALLREGYYQCVTSEGLNGIVSPEGELLVQPTYQGVYPDNLVASFSNYFREQGIPEEDVITILTSGDNLFVFTRNGELVQLD